MCPTTLSFQPFFSKFAPIIHWTMLQTPVHFCHHLVTFVATRGPTSFFLYVPYNTLFSTDLFQIRTKSSLDSVPDSSIFLSPINDICGHEGAYFVLYCVDSTEQSFQPIIFKFASNIHWPMLLTSVHFFSPIS